MKDAGLNSVDLWIGTGGVAIARLVAPIIKPKAYLPVHWEGLYSPLKAGLPRAYSDPALEQFLSAANVKLLKPGQYIDKWRLDGRGIVPIENNEVKKALGSLRFSYSQGDRVTSSRRSFARAATHRGARSTYPQGVRE
jgi:hypothetical protein